MDYRTFHSWNVSPSKAIAIQKDLRAQLVLDQAPGEIQTVAGIDVSYTRGSNKLYASVVVLDLTKPSPENHRSFPIIETGIESLEIDFPYIPGLLSFREIPVVLSV